MKPPVNNQVSSACTGKNGERINAQTNCYVVVECLGKRGISSPKVPIKMEMKNKTEETTKQFEIMKIENERRTTEQNVQLGKLFLICIG